jgi:hypothetical protein
MLIYHVLFCTMCVVQLGLSDLGRLTEQLAATEAKLDRAKVDSYFPKIKGFR